MKDFAEAFVPAVAIVFIFGIPGIIIFWNLHNKHKEKMRLIEKGLSSEEVKEYFRGFNAKQGPNPYSALKWGILFTMVGLGIFLGIILEAAGFSDSLVPVMILLFAGVGFIIYYSVLNSKLKKEKESKQAVQSNPQV